MKRYDPQIYPWKLWIAIKDDAELKQFTKVIDFPDDCHALVETVIHTESNKHGSLICFSDISIIDFERVSHESAHVASDIYNYIGATHDFNNQEPFTYLIGWIAKCIELFKQDLLKDRCHE